MGIGIAIAAVATEATIESDIVFTEETDQKQKELNSTINSAQEAINSANDFYQNVYNIVKTRLEHLKQSMRKLPSDVVDKLTQELQQHINDPSKVMKDIGLALGITQSVVGVVGLVSAGLTEAGIAAADGIIAFIEAGAGAAGAALAVVGFGLTLYNGITALNKINEAIDKVNGKRQEAEDAMSRMKNSLENLLSAMKLKVESYETLKDISDDWAKLAANFDTYSTAFYTAMTGFARRKSQMQVNDFLRQRGSPPLKDDILALAKLIEDNILQMIREGQSDEEIVDFYAKENPHEGLRFVMDSYFVSTLRSFAT